MKPSKRDFLYSVSERPQNMSFVYGDVSGSLLNRKSFLNNLSIDHTKLVCANQTHSNFIKSVKLEDAGKGAENPHDAIKDTDALITNCTFLPLAVFTADCLSIFLWDPESKSVGIVHAGWRSSLGRITFNAAEKMSSEFGLRKNNLRAVFGPCLKSCCYEVGPEFNDYFNLGVHKRNEKYFLDLVEINKQQLLDAGIIEENISGSSMCTACRNDLFFSYRKEKANCGRMMSVIMIK